MEKKVTGLMKYELDGKIITELAVLRPKTYSYLTDDSDENRKAKRVLSLYYSSFHYSHLM